MRASAKRLYKQGMCNKVVKGSGNATCMAFDKFEGSACNTSFANKSSMNKRKSAWQGAKPNRNNDVG